MVTEVKLRFGGVDLIVSAEGEFDTVVLRLGDFAADADVTHVDVSRSVPWSELIGLAMRWGWELTNHQGYADGVRFDLASPDADISKTFDLIVAGSTLHMNMCTPTRKTAE